MITANLLTEIMVRDIEAALYASRPYHVRPPRESMRWPRLTRLFARRTPRCLEDAPTLRPSL